MQSSFRFILIIFAIVAVIVVWTLAPEIRIAERQLLDAWGVPTWVRYVLSGALGFAYAGSIYSRTRRVAAKEGRSILRWQIIVIAISILVLGILGLMLVW